MKRTHHRTNASTNIYDVTLEEQVNELEETVIVGYGTQRKNTHFKNSSYCDLVFSIFIYFYILSWEKRIHRRYLLGSLNIIPR